MADRPVWQDEVEPSLTEASKDAHGHLYFNLGGSYRGYETVTADCHPHGAVYRCHMWHLWSETGFTGEAKDTQKGRALDLKARSGRQ